MKAALVLVSLSLISDAQDDWRRALDRANSLRLTDPGGANRQFETAQHLAKQVGDEPLVRVWIDLAEFLIQQRRHGDAVTVLRKAQAVQDQNPGTPPASRATVLGRLARTQLALGRREESIDLLRQVTALLEGARVVDQAALLPSMNLLAALYIQTGRIDAAKLTIHKAVRIATRVGKDRDRAETWIALSEIERTAGNYSEARRAARNALKLLGAPAQENSPLLEGVHNQLARIAYETSDYGMAAAHWKLMLDLLSARRPDNDAELLTLRADIARIAVAQGRLQEAEKELLAITRLAEDNGHQAAVANSLYVLGTLYAERKRFDKAIAAFIRSLAITDKEFGELSPNSAICVADLAKVYLENRQPAEAAKLSGRIAKISPSDEAVAMAWSHVMQIHAHALEKLNRKAEAKEVNERASRLVASRRARNQIVDVVDLTRK